MSLPRMMAQTVLLLIITVIVFEIVDIDLWLETLFRDHGHWLLDRDAQPWRFIFYDGVKQLFGIFAIGLLSALLLLRKRLPWIAEHRLGLWTLMLTMIAVPTLVNFLKWYTDIPCPRDIMEFGGDAPYVTILMHYPAWFLHDTSLRCYPAGHASGGFALMALYFVSNNPVWRKRGLMFGISIGWVIGIYKMVIGDHFLSHTIVSMFIAWLVACAIAWLLKPHAINFNEAFEDDLVVAE